MSNKDILKLVGLGSLVVILAILLTVVSISKGNSTKEEQKKKIQAFSENFTKDFSTYKYSEPDDYKNRLEKYISTLYWNEFIDKYGLGNTDDYTELEKKNYSKYISSEINITNDSIQQSKYLATINFTFETLTEPDYTKKSNQTADIEARIIKVNNEYKIESLEFASN